MAPAEKWDQVFALHPEQKLQVRLDLRHGALCGNFVAADAGSLTVRVNGTSETFPREAVRQVRAVKKGREQFRLYGGLAIVAAGGIGLASSINQARDTSHGRFPGEHRLGLMPLHTISAGIGGVLTVLGNLQASIRAGPTAR